MADGASAIFISACANWSRASFCLLVAFVLVPTASAQHGAGVDLGLRSAHIWRGQTQSSGWGFQPSVFGYSSWRWLTATAGFWTHVEPSDIDIGEGVGYRQSWFGEVNTWIDLMATVPFFLCGPAHINSGWVGYFVDNDHAVGPTLQRATTHEIYFGLRLRRPRLTPHATLWWDVDSVKGGYLETGLQYRVPGWTQVLLPLGSLSVDATAAWSFGQEKDDTDLAESAYFQNRGLTHIDFSAATTIGHVHFPFKSGNSAIHLELHVQYTRDPLLRSFNEFADEERRWKVWAGLTWTIIWPRCQPDRGICPN